MTAQTFATATAVPEVGGVDPAVSMAALNALMAKTPDELQAQIDGGRAAAAVEEMLSSDRAVEGGSFVSALASRSNGQGVGGRA